MPSVHIVANHSPFQGNQKKPNEVQKGETVWWSIIYLGMLLSVDLKAKVRCCFILKAQIPETHAKY